MKDFIGLEQYVDEAYARRTDHRFHAPGCEPLPAKQSPRQDERELAQLEEAGWLAALLSGEEPAPEAWRGDARRSEGNLAVAADHVPGPGQLRQWADYLEGLFDRMGEFLDEY